MYDVPNHEPWMTQAGCTAQNVDPEIFFPERAASAWLTTKASQAVCGECPVRLECLVFALKAERGLHRQYRHGIWGGLTPQQRHDLANSNRKQNVA